MTWRHSRPRRVACLALVVGCLLALASWNLGLEVAAGSHDVNAGPGVTVAAMREFAEPPAWQEPVTLSSSARAPSIHVNDAGTVIAFMRSGTFPSWRDMAWEHQVGGQWPSSPTPLAPAGAEDALLAMNDGGAAVVVWTNGSLLEASYRPAGGAWGPTETVAGTGGPYSGVRIAMDDAGDVAVAWYRNTAPSTALVEVALRTASSEGGWLPVVPMAASPRGVDTAPDVAFEADGEVVLAWGSLTATPSYTQLLASSRSLGGSWSTPTVLSPAETSAQDISLIGNGAGTVIATWHDVSSVRAAVRTGGSWGASEVLASPAGIGSLADIGRAAVDAAGNATALWSRHDGVRWRVEAATRPAGGSWQLPAVALAMDAAGTAQPVIAGNDAGDLAATWRQSDGATVRVAAALRPAGGTWPTAPVFVSTPGTAAESARVVVDSTGLAAAVWIEGGFQGVAKAAFSDGVPPLPTITVPADSASYEQGTVVNTDYTCSDNLDGQLTTCSGAVPSGGPLPTATPGPASFSVTATDRAGNALTVTHAYTVAEPSSLAITGVTEIAHTIPRYGRFEASIELSETFVNPFDPEEIRVDVTFAAPSGHTEVVPAFWYQPITASGTGWEIYASAGAPGWRVRFAPTEVGVYTYSVAAAAGARSALPVSGSFQATASASKGFVRIDTRNGRYLRFDSGDPYVPVGHNVAFEDGNPNLNGVGYYSNVFGSLGRAGENWSRVWMTDFNRSALEWGEGHYSGLYHGPGVYSLASAWRMDRILELAEQNGVGVQLVLNDHGQFSNRGGDRWGVRCDPADSPPCEPGDVGYDPGNAYSDANGGPVPLARPDLFFSSAAARDLMKNRLRYIVARWGAFRSVLAWELFNEVQFVGTHIANPFTSAQLRSDIVDWHADMAQYLKTEDPFGHLVTTSSAIRDTGAVSGLNAVWSLPTIDVVQVHWYEPQPQLTTTDLSSMVDQFESRYGKPVIVGELGLPSPNPEAGFNPATFGGSSADREHLTEGTHLHNAMWSTAVSESGAMYWWWGNYLAADPSRNRIAPKFPLNERLVPPLRGFLAGEDWAPLGLDTAALTASGPVVAVGSSSRSRAYVWVRDDQNEYETGARPGDLAGRSIVGASVAIPGLDAGRYRVRVYDTWGDAGVTSAFTATVAGGALTVALPAFTRDVAVKVDPAVGTLGDSDHDGVDDGIDAGNGAFDDAAQGTRPTTGTVVSGRVTVTDAADPVKGVVVTAVTDAVLIVCVSVANPTGFELDLPAGTSLTMTCGSVTVENVTGGTVIVMAPGGAQVQFPSGTAGTVDTTLTGGVTLIGVSGSVKLSLGGVTVPLPQGDSKLIAGNAGSERLTGTANSDVIYGNGGGDSIDAKGGNDVIVTGSGNDLVDGGAGNDWIDTGHGNNTVKGGDGNDTITAGSGNDTIDGGSGTDTCTPGGGKNTVKNCP